MNAMVVESGGFPYGRQATCCRKKLLVGESVMVSDVSKVSQERVVFHKRCLVRMIAKMPNDSSDVMEQFAALKRRMVETKEFWPKKPRKRKVT